MSEHGELKRVVNSFLQLLDNFNAPSLIIAAWLMKGCSIRRFGGALTKSSALTVPREQIPALVKRKLSAFRHKGLEIDRLPSRPNGRLFPCRY
ncbi:MAG: hypothetical protein R2911_14845 [Caldilineaceae bacterium]